MLAMRYDGAMKKISRQEFQKQLLGGLSPGEFLAEYWQKRPLLVRSAMPGFSGLLSPDELAGLACEEDVQSRLVMQKKGQWLLEHGPFEEEHFARLPPRDWTLLVQGLNHHLQEGTQLLQRFDFVPHARLDDLMVSYAPDGGGVGPHFDSYDVFLLQGFGKRLWRVSEQKDLTLIEGAPLRILKNFHTQYEYVLEPGDMLYLPPQAAHWGIAVGDCMTYSIGFRAPSVHELATEFLAFLQEKCDFPGMYADPDLKRQPHPAEIGNAMLNQVAGILSRIHWNKGDIAEFLGKYLSEPKPHVLFEPPRRMDVAVFRKKLEQKGVRLGLKSQMLFSGSRFFLNGEMVNFSGTAAAMLRQLADTRELTAVGEMDESLLLRLHEWYLAGYIEFID